MKTTSQNRGAETGFAGRIGSVDTDGPNLTFDKLMATRDLCRFGVRIFPAPLMVTQWRFPRTKKRRIRNKWAKRTENLRPDPNLLWDEGAGIVYGHPETVDRLRDTIYSQNAGITGREAVRCMHLLGACAIDEP